jgi:hypothetical protein
MISSLKITKILLVLFVLLEVYNCEPVQKIDEGDYTNLTIKNDTYNFFYVNLTEFKKNKTENIISFYTTITKPKYYARIVDSDIVDFESIMPKNKNDSTFEFDTIPSFHQVFAHIESSRLENCVSCFLLVTVHYYGPSEEIELFISHPKSTFEKYTDDFKTDEFKLGLGEIAVKKIFITNSTNYFLSFNSSKTIDSLIINDDQIPNFKTADSMNLGEHNLINYYFFDKFDYQSKGANQTTFTLLLLGTDTNLTIIGKNIDYTIAQTDKNINEVRKYGQYITRMYHHFALKAEYIPFVYDPAAFVLRAKFYKGKGNFFFKQQNINIKSDISAELENMNITELDSFTEYYAVKRNLFIKF